MSRDGRGACNWGREPGTSGMSNKQLSELFLSSADLLDGKLSSVIAKVCFLQWYMFQVEFSCYVGLNCDLSTFCFMFFYCNA